MQNNEINNPAWRINDCEDHCSKCGMLTEYLIYRDDDGIDYVRAERCLTCGIVMEFE